jgi:hypothetical protein
MGERYDIVLAGGRIVDGCGNPWYRGDVAVRGRAEDLLLLLWGRRGIDAEGNEVFGDAELLARFLAAIRL